MSVSDALRDGLRACGVGPGDSVLVGVSGGLDSTALLRLLVEIGQPGVAAHVDHGLRDDGGEDAAFVADLAACLGVPFTALAVTVAPGNVQAEARRARYDALAQAATRHDCSLVATAHTASDQAETVLAALARGAGLRGLAGMPQRRPLLQFGKPDHGPSLEQEGSVARRHTAREVPHPPPLSPPVQEGDIVGMAGADKLVLIRPLLGVTRAALRAHADAQGWTWREDPTNAGRAVHRNRLRADVMPWLRDERGAEVDLRIAASADAARAALALVQARLGTLAQGPGRLSVAGLRAVAPGQQALLLAEAVAQVAPEAVRSREVVLRLVALVDAPAGSRVEGGGLRVWRERDGLRFEGALPDGLGGALAATPLDALPTSFPASPEVEVVDADAVRGDVTVRGWRAGDRIRPLGLDGSQLVSDLLRERGVPRADRARVPVVLVGGEVAWVVGHRLAAGVAIRPETRRAVEWAWRWGDGAG